MHDVTPLTARRAVRASPTGYRSAVTTSPRDQVRTVGIEEELLLLDPETRQVAPRSRAALKAHRDRAPGDDTLDQELFRHQVETRTEPVTVLDDALGQLCAARRSAGEAARAAGAAAVASGIVPFGPLEPQVSPDDRYRAMLEQFGDVARSGGTCGMHVHVGIESPEEGVAVIDRVAPWLPALLAISTNSPYAAGRDTGYASWRAQVWSRWPSAGTTEAFGSLAGYERACRDLLATGAARDEGMLYFDARLSREHPTVELRVFDVCTDPEDALLAAALARALVSWAADEHAAGEPVARPRAELLRAAHWRASRYGTTGRLVDPRGTEPLPAAEVLDSLVATVRPWLERAGDLELVQEGVARVLRASGATQQRAAYERAAHRAAPGEDRTLVGVRGVVDDLVGRSEQVWEHPGSGNG